MKQHVALLVILLQLSVAFRLWSGVRLGMQHRRAAEKISAQNSPSPSITSPFADPQTAPQIHSEHPIELELTIHNVNHVLDKVRPSLRADGGDVLVKTVNPDTRAIQVSLQGACGSCPSSKITMKMGIERVLREHFRDLTEVSAVESSDRPASLRIDDVYQSLLKLETALKGLGAKAEVASVDDAAGLVVIRYLGPDRLKKGLEMVIKDDERVQHVKFIDMMATSPPSVG